MSCFLRSLLNYVPYAPSCPICLMPYVLLCPVLWLLSCPTSLALCMLSFLMCLVPYLLCTSRTLCLTYLVPYVFSCLKCLTCSCISRVLYLACSYGARAFTSSCASRLSLASGVYTFYVFYIYKKKYISCLVAFISCASCTFDALAIWVFYSLG